MRILITGGAGFIGSALSNQLISRGHEVGSFDKKLSFINKPHYYKAALAHRAKHYKNRPEFEFEGDIRNETELKKAFGEFRPEVIVHLAGLPMARPLPEYEGEMIPINMEGTLKVLEAFENSISAKKFIYTSSSMSYGHFIQSPQSENVILNPINSYGATKAGGEYFVKLSKKEWVIVRPTSVYGYTDAANRVTQLLLDAAITGKNAWVVKGETLDFSYVEDVADGFVKCIESSSSLYETFNISRGEPKAASEFAEHLKVYFPDFSYEVREPTSQQVYRGALDITKARKFLEFNPKYTIDDGIKEILELVKEYNWKKDAY